jgi:hypothetical protein
MFPPGVKGTAVRGASGFGVGGKWVMSVLDGVAGISGSANPPSAVPDCFLPDLMGDPRWKGDFRESNLCFAFWTLTTWEREVLLGDAVTMGEA